ncbi:uncharacterized protein LOC143292149 [Babylonia areolata]|uniref:uncharacterized protein LOC143292149 n=1 Tax=Babylonia areolata TaxID=304850 RepID=UPI003FD36A9F
MAGMATTVCVFLVMVLVFPRSGTSQRAPEGPPLYQEGGEAVPGVSDIQTIECPERWSCWNYDYRRLSGSVRGHYLDRSCACDELCLLLRDCCPDAHLAFAAPPGSQPFTRPPPPKYPVWTPAPRTAFTSPPGDWRGNVSPSRYHRYPPLGPRVPKYTPLGPQASENPRVGPQASQQLDPRDRNPGAPRGPSGLGPWNSNSLQGPPGADPENPDSPQGASVLRTNRGDSSNEPPRPSLSVFQNDSDSGGGGRWVPNDEVYGRYGLDRDMFSCLYDRSITAANNVSLVTRCPAHYDDVEVTQLCVNVSNDDLMTRLPVSGKVSRVLYRNMFCAMCHEEPYLFWAVSVTCHSRHSLPYDVNTTSLPTLLNNREDCRMQFRSPADGMGWRPCVDDVKDRCNDTFPRSSPRDQYIVSRCEDEADLTQPMVFGFTLPYRNQYCSLCNHNNFPLVFCKPLSWEHSGGYSPQGTRSTSYSFSILLDINTNTGSATVGRIESSETVERNETRSCQQGHVFDPFQSACRPVTCGPGRFFKDNTCQKKSPRTDESTSSIFRHRDPDTNSSTVYVLPESDCAFIQLNDTEYRLFHNGTLELLADDGGALYNSSQYVHSGGRLFLCVPYSTNYTHTVTDRVHNQTFTFSLTEAVVSTCGICISVLALAVTIVVYLSLRALRNIPGKNLLSLACSLFLADLLLLVAHSAADVFLACAVIAGVMHYFFLASFLWMNVMAVDVWFTFSKAFVKAGDRGKSSKRFFMYSAYCWLTPLVFLFPAALIQALKPDSEVSPRYGEGICWLGNKHALLLFFAAPLLILLILNIVLFLVSARNISRAKQTTARMLGKEDEGGRMAIYVKLTVVMGITWVFGFLAALVPGNKVLTYCFVIMNSLQGLFICLSFVFTRKVLSLLRDKLCRRRKFKVTKSASTDMTNLSKSTVPANNRMTSSSSSKSHNVMV